MSKPYMKHKAEFLAALRETPQGRYRLRTDEGFCCLGVACNLVDPNGWRQYTTGVWDDEAQVTVEVQQYAWQDTRPVEGGEAWRGPSQTVVMGREAMDYLGMGDPNPSLYLSDESKEQLTPYYDNRFSISDSEPRTLGELIRQRERVSWSALNDAAVPFAVVADILDREYDAFPE